MKDYVLILLCCWSLVLGIVEPRYNEVRELTASVRKHQQVGVMLPETALHVKEVHAPVIRVKRA